MGEAGKGGRPITKDVYATLWSQKKREPEKQNYKIKKRPRTIRGRIRRQHRGSNLIWKESGNLITQDARLQSLDLLL